MKDYRSLFREALEYGKTRNYSEAIVRLRHIVSVTDEIEEAFLYLGRSYHALGTYDQAIDMLRRFIELRPESAAGHFFLGRAFLSAEEYGKAAKVLEKALTLRPDLSYAKSLLGYVYLKTGNSAAAVDLLGEAVQSESQNRTLYNGYLNALLVEGIKKFRGDSYEYAEEVFRFLVDHGSGGILPHLYLGMIHRVQGEYEEALADYRRAQEYSPNDELIAYRIGVLLLKTGRNREADTVFSGLRGEGKKAPAPTGIEADRHLAEQYFKRSKYSQALHYALQVLHKDKNDTGMHLLAGECYRELGELDHAGNHFTRVFDTDKNHIGAHYGIALVHWQKHEYREMLGRLRKIERLDPGNETVHYYTVLCSWKLETEPSELLPLLQEAVRTFGPDPHLFTALARTYEHSDYPELAYNWYRKVLLLDDSNVEAYRGIISLYRKSEEATEMEEIFEKYFDLVPDDPGSLRLYIQYLFEKGNLVRTIEKIEEYLSSRNGATSADELYFQRMRAICYRKTEKFETAAELYRRLLRTDPEKEEFLRPYIYCLEKSAGTERAADIAEKAINYITNSSTSLCLIAGVLWFRLDNSEKALQFFRKATTVDPKDWRGFYNIGEVYRRKGMEEFARRFTSRAEALRSS